MPQINVGVINASTVLSDSAVEAVVPALQTQVKRDFTPVWGISAHVHFVPNDSQNHCPNMKVCQWWWWLVILDDSDVAGYLGYRDFTSQGLPLGKVFARRDMDVGRPWTVTASHELLEMLVDPAINLTVFRQNSETTGRVYAYDICDPCQQDIYRIDDKEGPCVSNFVYPNWFRPSRPGEICVDQKDRLFDHLGHMKEPFELLRGGYISVFDIPACTGWQQMFFEQNPDRYDMDYCRPRMGSRRERRRRPGELSGSAAPKVPPRPERR